MLVYIRTTVIENNHLPLSQYKCRGAMLLRDGKSAWRSPDEQLHRYFAGDGSEDMCACGIRGNAGLVFLSNVL